MFKHTSLLIGVLTPLAGLRLVGGSFLLSIQFYLLSKKNELILILLVSSVIRVT
jgi:hypothetical protein